MAWPTVVTNFRINEQYYEKTVSIINIMKTYAKGFGGEFVGYVLNPTKNISLSVSIKVPESKLKKMVRKEILKYCKYYIVEVGKVLEIV